MCFSRRKHFRKRAKKTIKLSQFVTFRAEGKKTQESSVNNLEMLPEHQAKFISNSIFSLAKNLLFQIPSFITFEKSEKSIRFLANLMSKKTSLDVKCIFYKQSPHLKAKTLR